MNFLIQLNELKQKIREAEHSYHREPSSTALLAISKKQSVEKIQAVYAAGQTCFGESYVQEALIKIKALEKLPIIWHFIGKIQSNKTKFIAQHFSWVHTVERLKIAELLNQHRPLHLSQLNICLQINASQSEDDLFDQIFSLAQSIKPLQNLNLRGLMTILKPGLDFNKQVYEFKRVKNLQLRLGKQGISLDTLSMGMTDDYPAAIAAGSTLIRIGTAIFGPRSTL